MAIHSLPIPSTPQCPHSGSGHGRSSLILHGSPRAVPPPLTTQFPAQAPLLGCRHSPGPRGRGTHAPRASLVRAPAAPGTGIRWLARRPVGRAVLLVPLPRRDPEHGVRRRPARPRLPRALPPLRPQLSAYYQRKAEAETETEPPCRFDGRLATPTVLLLCRAITRECLPFLKERVFVVDRIPPWPRGDMAPPKISRFLGRTTFQNLRYIDIRLSLGEGSLGSGWVWGPLVDDLLDILGEWNSFDCLRILFRYHDVTQHNVWHEESKIYRNLVEKVGTQSRINSSRSRAPLLTNNPHVAV